MMATRKGTKNDSTNQGPNTVAPQTMEATINRGSYMSAFIKRVGEKEATINRGSYMSAFIKRVGEKR